MKKKTCPHQNMNTKFMLSSLFYIFHKHTTSCKRAENDKLIANENFPVTSCARVTNRRSPQT